MDNQHQHGIHRLINYYFQTSTFIPSEQIDFILLALSTMFYSITQLAHAALDLGTTIHEVFELETTDLYQSF